MIAIGDFQVQTDGTYLVPVKLMERDGILSGTLSIGYDSGVKVVGVTTGVDYSRFMIAHNAGKEGVKIAFAGARSEVTGAGDMLYLRVKTAGDVPLRLSLDRVFLNGQNLTPEFVTQMTAGEMPERRLLVFALHQNMPNCF